MKLHRSMFQLYIRDADKALEFYKKAFDATPSEYDQIYYGDDGKIDHCEINVYGQVVALSESRHNANVFAF